MFYFWHIRNESVYLSVYSLQTFLNSFRSIFWPIFFFFFFFFFLAENFRLIFQPFFGWISRSNFFFVVVVEAEGKLFPNLLHDLRKHQSHQLCVKKEEALFSKCIVKKEEALFQNPLLKKEDKKEETLFSKQGRMDNTTV